MDTVSNDKNIDRAFLLKSMFEHATLGILMVDESGSIIDVNPFSCGLFGYDRQELVGLPLETLIPTRLRDKHVVDREGYFKNPKPRPMGIGKELFGLRKDGSQFPVEVSLSYAQTAEESVAIAFVSDITQRKRNEERLRRYASVLERSNRELQDFAYVSSHDLQEPLRKIQAFGDRLRIKEGENLSEKGVDYLNRMLSAAVRMQRLIADLLQFSRLSTKAKQFEQVDLNLIVEEVLSDLEIIIENSGATIEVKPLPIIEAEPTQMRQLFQNLIANAIKFRKEGVAPVIKIYWQEGKAGDSSVKILVEDNGIGFDEKYANKIFQIFQRLEGRKYEGSGIGLAICQRIAGRHGGSINAKSKEGAGSTFIINLSTMQQEMSIDQEI